MDRGSDGTASIDGLNETEISARDAFRNTAYLNLERSSVSPDESHVTSGHSSSIKRLILAQGAALISRNIRRPELRSLRSRLVVVARCDASTARRASDHVRSWLEHPLVPHQSSFTPQRDHAHTPHLPAHRRPQRRGATHVSVDTPGPAAAVVTAPEAAADLRRSLSRSPPSRPSGVEGGRILLKAFRRRRPWH